MSEQEQGQTGGGAEPRARRPRSDKGARRAGDWLAVEIHDTASEAMVMVWGRGATAAKAMAAAERSEAPQGATIQACRLYGRARTVQIAPETRRLL